MHDSWKQLKSDNKYFLTKHTDEFSQFADSITCREFSLPRDDKSTDLKCWIQGNTNIGPVLEVATSYLQGKHGVEIRIESVNKDNSHSWVRISHGLNKLVTDMIDKKYDVNEQEISTINTEEFALASSKAKAKPRRPINYLFISYFKDFSYSWKKVDWYWTRNSDRSSLSSGKKTEYSSPTRWITSRRRWSDRIQKTEKGSSEQVWAFSILVWWNMEEQDSRRRDNKNRFQFCTDRQDKKFFTFEFFKVIQDANNVLIPNNLFECIYHIGCAFNLHSIMNSGLIAGGQNSSRDRQTVFFTAVNPMQKNHQDKKEVDLTKPRLASYKQRWKVHQDTVYGWTCSLINGKDWSSFKQGRTQSSFSVHSQLIVSRKR